MFKEALVLAGEDPSLRRARMPIMDDSAPKLRSMGSRLLHPHDCAEICHTLHLPTGLMPPESRLV